MLQIMLEVYFVSLSYLNNVKEKKLFLTWGSEAFFKLRQRPSRCQSLQGRRYVEFRKSQIWHCGGDDHQ